MSQACLDHAERAEYTLSAQSSAAARCGLDNDLRDIGEYGAGGGNRTHGLGIMRPSLYH
jgi:hypothetical protein